MEQRLQPKLQFDQLRKWAYFLYQWEFFHYIPLLSLSVSLWISVNLLLVCFFYPPSLLFCSLCMCSLFTALLSVSLVHSAFHLHRLLLISHRPTPPPLLHPLCPPLTIYLHNVYSSLAWALSLSLKVKLKTLPTSIKLWPLFHFKQPMRPEAVQGKKGLNFSL